MVLSVLFDLSPRVILDGIVPRRDVIPGDEPGEGSVVLTGYDVSIALDRTFRATTHPALNEPGRVYKIVVGYPQYLFIPDVKAPPTSVPPLPLESAPIQLGTDWEYLEEMADDFGYVTYVKAGPVPLTNTLYWGPPVVPALPQKALNVNLGPQTNVSGVGFAHDGLAITLVNSTVKDAMTGTAMPVIAQLPTRPPLGLLPNALAEYPYLRTVGMDTTGLSTVEAFSRAQAILDRSTDDSISVTGTLDSLRYNDVLRARELVDLRGAGYSHDGTYLVRSVTHSIGRGRYTQAFNLSRAELAAKSPIVRAN